MNILYKQYLFHLKLTSFPKQIVFKYWYKDPSCQEFDNDMTFGSESIWDENLSVLSPIVK